MAARCTVAEQFALRQKDRERVELTTVAEAIPEVADLTVDVTHGLRHFWFLAYVGVLYLAALRRVTVRGRVLRSAETEAGANPVRSAPAARTAALCACAGGVVRDGSALPMAAILRNGPSSRSQFARRCADDLTNLSAAKVPAKTRITSALVQSWLTAT